MRILVAIDGSDGANAAVAWLGRLPLPAGQTIKVMTAVVPPLAVFDVDKANKVREELLARARRLVDDTAAQLRAHGVALGEVTEDDARDAIVAAAGDWRADLIVMGARGRRAAARFLLGSVSLSVARHAPCPVLACKGSPRDLRAVTVALDGSDHARLALDWTTTNLSLSAATKLRLLGVVEPQHYPSSAPAVLAPALGAALAAVDAERRAALEAELARLAQSIRARVLEVETVVEAGPPADVIVRDVERSGADMVALGARGLTGLKRLLLGSVSEAVLNHAPCSVLIVRAHKS